MMRSNTTRILFVHIPKSAGMSLYNALANSLGRESAIRFADGSEANKSKYLAMSDEEIRRFNLVSGHFSLPFFLNKPLHDYKVITLLRNPVDRELSAYFYMKTWAQHPRHHQVKPMDLYQFLGQREKQQIRNPQCWQISGDISFEVARKAIDNQFFLAAPIEHIKKFCDVLETNFDLHINIKRDNETSFRLTASEIHPDIIARFEALTKGDMALYRYVKDKFEREFLGKTQ